MKRARHHTIAVGLFLSFAVCLLPGAAWAHVTLREAGTLHPGGYANITLNVPTERHVDTTKVTLEIPDAFLKAGGRLSRVEYPPGWEVSLEKEDKPGDVYGREEEQRASRRQTTGSEHEAKSGKTAEEQLLKEMRKQWVKRVTFSGGSISPDGFKEFRLSFQMPDKPGTYRFAAVQTYADGKDVSWSELVEGAEHPAATLRVEPNRIGNARDISLVLAWLVLLFLVIRPYLRSPQPRKRESAALESAVNSRA